MRVLALVPHPPTVASVRFRVGQYLEPLGRRDIHLELASFFELEKSRSVYGGRLLGPARATLRAYRRRLAGLRRVAGYDAVLVHREITPFGNGMVADRVVATGVPYL